MLLCHIITRHCLIGGLKEKKKNAIDDGWRYTFCDILVFRRHCLTSLQRVR